MSGNDTWEINAVIESVEYINLAVNDGGNSGDLSSCRPVLIPNTACRYEVGTDLELI